VHRGQTQAGQAGARRGGHGGGAGGFDDRPGGRAFVEGSASEWTSYGSIHKRVDRMARAAAKNHRKLREDMSVWYSRYLADGRAEGDLEAYLAAQAAIALPPRDPSDARASAALNISTALGVVHAPVNLVPYRGSVEEVLENLRAQPTYRGQIAHVEVLQGQEADLGASTATLTAGDACQR